MCHIAPSRPEPSIMVRTRGGVVMDKQRLTRMLDILFALAMFQLIFENIGIPYPRTFEGFWRLHREVFRAAA